MSRDGAASVEYVMVAVVIISGIGLVTGLVKSISQPVMVASNQLFEGNAADIGNGTTQAATHRIVPATRSTKWNIPYEALHVGALLLLTGVYIWKIRHPQKPEEQEFLKVAHGDAGETLRMMIYAKRNGLLSAMSQDVQRMLDSRVDVSHLMSISPRVVQPEHSADDVRRMMTTSKMHHLMVCDGQRLIGVISDRDLTRPDARYASDLMTRNPITVPPHTLLIPAVTTMINKRFSCLPVTEGNKLVGVLTRTDLLVAFQCMLHITSKLQSDSAAPAEEAALSV